MKKLGLVFVALSIQALPQAPNLILTNGKIITVNEQFRIAQAIAVRDDRIAAVGSNQEITRLAGPNTRRIDLQGRAVIPGLIDNHAHIMEEGAIWSQELRLDGVDSRREALRMLRERDSQTPAGQWIYTLGGWSIDQFADDKKLFSREELDQAAPNHPVLLQFTRSHTFLNSRAIEAIGLEKMTEPWIVRDAAGRPTGVIEAAGIAQVGRAIPEPPKNIFESGSMQMVRDLNRAGLTTAGGPCPREYMDAFRQWGREGKLNLRFFCFVSAGSASNAQQVDALLPRIAQLKPFQGDLWVDETAYGESVYQPLHDNMLAPVTNPTPEQLLQWRRIATEVAKAGLPLHVHATIENTITTFLDQIEIINKEYPIRNLRWALAHVDQVNASHLERMKKLGMYLAVHTRPTIMGRIFNRAHGDRSFDMPPLKLIQDSGIVWGLGTDTFEVNQYRPFTTLWWAVTGKMVGGSTVLRQTISREDALIAHTRKNAYLVFQENNLGSIQPGKLADFVVLDQDYLTVPADRIKDIQPVMTVVGGRIAYQAQ
jgi:predicted amidohydrolase YtcJ